MKEKPILFSTPMVQAILEGRKTQTRRVIKPQPVSGIRRSVFVKSGIEDGHGREIGLRYLPGDILYVRETWNFITCEQCKKSGEHSDLNPGCVAPLSSRDRYKNEYGCFIYRADSLPPDKFKWRPSIHMPKEAARLFLEVTDARIERVQEILINGMLAEGCVPEGVKGGQWQQWQRDYFMPLWDTLYGKRGYPWENNPYVWVYEFMRTEARP